MSCTVAFLPGPAHVHALQQPLHLDFDAEFAAHGSSSVAASCRHCYVAAYLAVHFSALDYFHLFSTCHLAYTHHVQTEGCSLVYDELQTNTQ